MFAKRQRKGNRIESYIFGLIDTKFLLFDFIILNIDDQQILNFGIIDSSCSEVIQRPRGGGEDFESVRNGDGNFFFRIGMTGKEKGCAQEGASAETKIHGTVCMKKKDGRDNDYL